MSAAADILSRYCTSAAAAFVCGPFLYNKKWFRLKFFLIFNLLFGLHTAFKQAWRTKKSIILITQFFLPLL